MTERNNQDQAAEDQALDLALARHEEEQWEAERAKPGYAEPAFNATDLPF